MRMRTRIGRTSDALEFGGARRIMSTVLGIAILLSGAVLQGFVGNGIVRSVRYCHVMSSNVMYYIISRKLVFPKRFVLT